MWSVLCIGEFCCYHKFHDTIDRCSSFSPSLHDDVMTSEIARFMRPTWGPPGDNRTQVGPMLAPWTLLSGMAFPMHAFYEGNLLIRSQYCRALIYYLLAWANSWTKSCWWSQISWHSCYTKICSMSIQSWRALYRWKIEFATVWVFAL